MFHISAPPKLKPPLYPIQINGNIVNILIDSGASVNILDEPTFNKIKPKPNLEQTGMRIYSFQSSEPLQTIGKFIAQVSVPSHTSIVEATFLVVKGHGGSLLSRQTAEALDILRVGPPPSPQIETANQVTSTDSILDKHSDIFKGLGRMTNVEVKLHMNEDIHPVQQPIRRVPWHTRQRVDDEIKRLLESDIIEKVPDNEPTTWLNPYVVVPKKDPTQIRFCLDMRQANQAIIRERHVIPKFEELLPELHDAKVFSKIDLREGYHQLSLHEDSRHVTAFATHKGVYRYKRLFFGISSAFETFQKHVEITLAGCKGARNISDDILIWGKYQEDHDKNLDEALKKLNDRHLKLKRNKCIFSVDSLVFAGHCLSARGISPEQSKIDAIKAIQRPTNATEVRSFLGLANFCSRFIKDYATITEPLRRLTRKKCTFIWGTAQETAFNQLKSSLSDDSVIAYYNPEAPTKITVDASPVGLGAILSQTQPDGESKVVAYASRSLNPVERRYSQTEREALACAWSLQHYHYYIADRDVEIVTDHKPLTSMLSNKSTPPPRIQRWLMRMQAYRYTVTYQPGCNNAADTLSRNPLSPTEEDRPEYINMIRVDETEEYINMITNHAAPKGITLEEITKATQNDPVLAQVIESITSNSWNRNLKPYHQLRHSLSTHKGILLKDHNIVVPASLRNTILQLAHKQHLGIVKTKSLLREKVWWPGISADIDKFISSCHACQIITPTKKSVTPLQISEMPKQPWQTIGIDIKGPVPSGENLLVLLDYHSRYPIVHTLNRSSTSAEIIKKLEKTFSLFGYPQRIICDNGKQFISTEFKQFLSIHNIEHHPVLTVRLNDSMHPLARYSATLKQNRRIGEKNSMISS